MDGEEVAGNEGREKKDDTQQKVLKLDSNWVHSDTGLEFYKPQEHPKASVLLQLILFAS